MTKKQALISASKNILLFWNRPVWAMLIAMIVYGAYSWPNMFQSTFFNYFTYLADAFLHGQTYLRLEPPTILDLVLYNEQLYLYWLPMPAILIMPLVAIFGIATSDIFITIFLGGLNVFLFTILLQKAKERQIHNLDNIKQAIFVIFFSFGTVHFTLTPYGKVWQLSQEVSLIFMLLAYLAVISFRGWKAFLFTGIALAGAMLTRSNVILVGIWPAYYLIHSHWEQKYKKLFGLLTLASLPIFLGVFFLMEYNRLRFGNPFEMGVQYHQVSAFLTEAFEKYGYFSTHYIPINLYYNFLYYPFPLREEWVMGGSLFLLSPVFFGAFASFQNKKQRLSHAFLTATILIVYIPIVLLMGTGYITFGPRYTLDFIVPLLLLTASGIEKWPSRTLFLLTLISCVHYFAGTYFLRGW